MTLAVVQPQTWAVEYAAEAAGPSCYAATVAATGLDPTEARHRWDVVVHWQPWGVTHEGHAVGQAARWRW